MKKPLKQMIKTKGKIDRWINEKPPNPVGTEEENRPTNRNPLAQAIETKGKTLQVDR